ncbi:MAG: nucleotide exchange factor GrpE [Phycisphaerales bacterium]
MSKSHKVNVTEGGRGPEAAEPERGRAGDPAGGAAREHGCCGGQGDGGCCGDAPAAEASDDPLTRLAQDLKEAQESRLRVLADFQNYQRRSLENESRAKVAGVAGVVRNVIPVLEHFDVALGQGAAMSAEQAAAGVRMLQTELLKALEKSGVERIEPRPGDEFDPRQHEAVMRQPAEGVGADRVSMVFQAGYRLGETVLRPAKVAVAP